MTMTVEQLEELLGNVTQGEWRITGKSSGYIVSKSENVIISNVGDYQDKDLLPFNKERWDADCALFSLAPSLARRVIAAEKLVNALRPVLEDLVERELPTNRETNELYAALTAYREANK